MSFQSDLLACLINRCSALQSAAAVGPTFIHHGALPILKRGATEIVVIDDHAAASGPCGHGIRFQILHRKIRTAHGRRHQNFWVQVCIRTGAEAPVMDVSAPEEVWVSWGEWTSV